MQVAISRYRPQVLPAIRVPWRPCVDGPQDGLSCFHTELLLQWEYFLHNAPETSSPLAWGLAAPVQLWQRGCGYLVVCIA
jgi:hypothetical protein